MLYYLSGSYFLWNLWFLLYFNVIYLPNKYTVSNIEVIFQILSIFTVQLTLQYFSYKAWSSSFLFDQRKINQAQLRVILPSTISATCLLYLHELLLKKIWNYEFVKKKIHYAFIKLSKIDFKKACADLTQIFQIFKLSLLMWKFRLSTLQLLS